MWKRFKRLTAVILCMTLLGNMVPDWEYMSSSAKEQVSAVREESIAQQHSVSENDISHNNVQNEDNPDKDTAEEDMPNRNVSGNEAEGSGGSVSGNTISGNEALGLRGPFVVIDNTGIGTHVLPLDVSEYMPGANFVITYPDDFLVLQRVSAYTDFQGVSFQIASPAGTVWKLNEIAGFTGIGTETYPFKGKMEGYYESGITFRFGKPLFSWLGDGASVIQLDIESVNVGSGVIADQIAPGADVSLRNITIKGSVSSQGAAGALAATVCRGAKLNLENIQISGMQINGKQAGAVAGIMEAGAVLVLAETAQTVKISGTVNGTESAGGLFGRCLTAYSYLIGDTRLVCSVQVVSYNNTSCVGTLIGQLAGQGKLLLTGAGTITANAAGSGIAGGIVGSIEDSALLQADTTIAVDGSVNGYIAGGIAGRISSSAEESIAVKAGGCTVGASVRASGTEGGGLAGVIAGAASDIWRPAIPEGITITGNIEGWSGSIGGLAGSIYKSCILPKVTIKGLVAGNITGGVIGTLHGGTRAIVQQVDMKGTLNAVATAGGVIGQALAGACAELGNIDVSGITFWGSMGAGQIVGRQTEALIYIGKDGSLTLKDALIRDMDEANIGGVFRNPKAGTGVLVGDGTLANVGKVNAVVGKSGESYVFRTAADFICYAIALNTQGRYGTEAFGGAAVTALLGAGLLVEPAGGKVDISYADTGIVTLNRNDIQDSSTAFTGTIKGVAKSTVILRNITTTQGKIGLFSAIGSGVVFEKLTFQGTMDNTAGAAALAYMSVGSSLTMKELKNEMTIINLKDSNAAYAGFVAEAKEQIAITAQDIDIAGSIVGGNGFGNYSSFITSIEKGAVVDLRNLQISAVLEGSNKGDGMGGFLGRIWQNTGGRIQDVTISGNAGITAMGGSTSFGGLLLKVKTWEDKIEGKRLILERISYDKVNILASRQNDCAMLISNAEDAVLEVIDYKISASGCTVTDVGTDFDDIAAKCKVGAGGIISLKSTSGSYPEWHYEQKIGSENANADVRYYYDLFGMWEKTPSGLGEVADANIAEAVKIKDNILDTPEKVMIWDAFLSCNWNIRPYLKRYISGYIEHGANSNTITFKGNLDMSRYSYYPVPPQSPQSGKNYVGTDTATITFRVPDWARTVGTNGQHARIQAGLFMGLSGTVKVNDLTLKGRVMNLSTASGALVCGAVNGDVAFHNIVLEDLWIDNYKGDAKVGLMVSSIPGGTASFNGISMLYPAGTAKKAAAALIGNAGSGSATDLKVEFRNMKIADEKAGGAVHNGNVLAHASFLCGYTYTDDVINYQGRGLYLFSEQDAAAGRVTWGAEINESTEYSDNSKKVVTNPGIVNAPKDQYLPYVCQMCKNKKIEVNPKTGDIKKGCGTYEDPYIIEDARQFLTLYRYMNETGTVDNYQYQSFYEGWQIPEMGDDNSFCSTANHAGLVFKKGDMREFPTPEELCKAYFKLGGDINLDMNASSLDSTYTIIAEEFAGIGLESRPFTGVFMGDKKGDGTYYTITLPQRETTSALTVYGLFQYVKGAVVKDVVIRNSNTQKAPVVNTAAGSVFGCVLGGDNIIDNVTVNTRIHAAAQDADVGGYVGTIRKGSLILRNVDADSVRGVSVFYRAAANVTTNDIQITSANNTGFPRMGQLVGMVEDGFVIYEGASDSTKPKWNQTADYKLQTLESDTYLPVSPSFAIANDTWLLQNTAGKIALTMDKGNHTLGVTLPNEASLYVLAIGLNSDALAIRLNGSRNYNYYTIGGYNSASVSRKAQYSSVGSCTAATPDYLFAAKYDNASNYGGGANNDAAAYPYVYKYLGITEDTYKEYIETAGSRNDKYQTIWNVPQTDGWRTTYTLAKDSTYDMSIFGNGFRGIGALYTKKQGSSGQTGYAGTFRANMNGNGSTVKLGMFIDDILVKAGSDALQAGLFNQLTAPYSADTEYAPYTIQNLKITGVIDTTRCSRKIDCGGVAGQIEKGRYQLEDISVLAGTRIGRQEGAAQSASGNAGGLVGKITSDGKLSIINGMVGEDTASAKKADISGTNAGGFIGHIASGKAAVINISGGRVYNTQIMLSDDGNKGGFIGYAESSNSGAQITIQGSAAEPCMIKDCIIEGNVYAGGVFGRIRAPLYMEYMTVDNVRITAKERAGGIIGNASDGAETIKNTKVTNNSEITVTSGSDSGGSGGIIGNGTCPVTMQDVTVENSVIKNTGEISAKKYAGGLIGVYSSKKAAILDAVLRNNSILAKGNGNKEYCAGGLIGLMSGGTAEISKISAIDNRIEAVSLNNTVSSLGSAGGIIGYLGNASVTLQYFKVEGTTQDNALILADRGAGGVIGRLKGNLELHAVSKAAADSDILKHNAVYNLTVYTNDYGNATSANGSYAGGAIGYIDGADNKKIILRDMTVEQASVTSVNGTTGGMIGYASGNGISLYSYNATITSTRVQTLKTQAKKMNDTILIAGGMVGSMSGNVTSYWSEPATRDIAIGFADSEDVTRSMKLISESGSLLSMPADITESNAGQYAVHIGKMIGTLNNYTGQTYVLYPSFRTDSGSGVRIVADAGRKNSTEALYSYRDNCHIVYETIFAGTEGADAKVKQYEQAINGPGYTLLDAYRLNTNLTEVFAKSYYPANTYSPPGTDNKLPKEMLVYLPELGTLQEVIDPALDIMTNVSGAPSSVNGILSVRADAKWMDMVSGDITPKEGAASIQTGSQGSQKTFNYNNYDIFKDGKVSFTLLTFKYEWSLNGVNTNYEFTIPVFVQEILEVNIYTRIEEGAVYDTEHLRVNGQKDAVLMANDSNYTIYSEFLYSAARKNQIDLTLDKEFFLMESVNEGAGEVYRKKIIPSGTRLTLLDVTDGNKAYYYEVTGTDVTTIPYKAFKDQNGNAWTARNIGGSVLPDMTTEGQASGTYHDLEGYAKTETGREQFILVLQKPKNIYYSKEAYSIHSILYPKDAAAAKKMNITVNNEISVTSIPGLKVAIVKSGDNATNITGEISRQGTVREKLVYSLTADPVYWAEKNKGLGLIDSQNHNKYLEAGMYFRDSEGNRVRLPSGTNVRYKNGAGAFSDWSVLDSTSIIYFYKSTDGYYQINNVNANVEVSLEMELNFERADLSTLTGSSYAAWIDLLRTSNKDYPMGNDLVVDSYVKEIPAAVRQQLGFAVDAADKNDLAVNTYSNSESIHILPFHTQFDFESILESLGGGAAKDSIAEIWAAKEYRVTYTVWEKKAEGAGYRYEQYKGNDIGILASDGVTISFISHMEPYQFSKEEILRGEVLNRKLSVWVNTENVDLSNYKIKATLQIADQGTTDTGGADATEDFFIFTVTKLKTDL